MHIIEREVSKDDKGTRLTIIQSRYIKNPAVINKAYIEGDY